MSQATTRIVAMRPSLLLLGFGGIAPDALAQTIGASAVPAHQEAPQSGGLEDIVVTARKQVENVQNVPVAETVVSNVK